MNRKDLPKANATCKVCGKPYYICKQCVRLQANGVYSWRLDADSEQCFKVFMVLEDFREKRMTKEMAKAALESIPVSDIATLTDDARATVDAIFRAPRKHRVKLGDTQACKDVKCNDV